MKAIIVFICIFFTVSNFTRAQEKHGDQLNIGFGIGYTGRYSSRPVVHLNYEFDVGRNFTLAPFITFYEYRRRDDYYRETVVPIGVKGSYYFDELFKANRKWDFYGAGSLGFAIINRTWDDDVPDRTIFSGPDNLYLDLHVGARVHLSSVVGLFLDLSTGISTFGLSFNLR